MRPSREWGGLSDEWTLAGRPFVRELVGGYTETSRGHTEAFLGRLSYHAEYIICTADNWHSRWCKVGKVSPVQAVNTNQWSVFTLHRRQWRSPRTPCLWALNKTNFLAASRIEIMTTGLRLCQNILDWYSPASGKILCFAQNARERARVAANTEEASRRQVACFWW